MPRIPSLHGQTNRHTQPGLPEAETAFYDPVVQNDAAVMRMAEASQ